MESTPSPSARARKHRRTRPRDSLEDEDDGALDAMLTELGIPSSGHRGAPNRSPSACVEVIELITPSPKKKQSDGPSSSVVDLTTSPSSPSPSPSISHGYINTVQEVAVAVAVAVDDEQEEDDEISFSYDPSESPPPFAYSLPAQVQAEASEDDEPEVLSPEMTTTARRRVFPEKSKKTGARQARRLSGHLKDLHSESTRACGVAGKRRETTTVAAVGEEAGAIRTTTGAPPCRSRTGGRATAGVIALVQMEKSLDTSAAGDGIREALKSHVYNGKPVPYSVATALNCIIPGVIRWERKGCGESHYSCAIYYEAGVFLEMVQTKGYKELAAAVRYIQSLVPKARKAQSEEESNKFFVVIQGMDRALIELKKQQKKKKTGPAPSTSSPMLTFADLQEVAFQLFMDMGVHTKFTCDLEATANYVALLTRELVAASSRATPLEEFLESVPRYNSFRVTHSGGTASVCANAWLRMLLVIPGVSEDKAQCLLNHFPTFDSLMRAYRDPKLSRAQKGDLVADKLHDARIQRALSKKIYSVFCEENPDALI